MSVGSVRLRPKGNMDNQKAKKRGHCIALFSGGLDSTLAILLMLRQDIDVTALTFLTHFGCDSGNLSPYGSDPCSMADKFGFNIKLMHLGRKFVDIVEHPRFGRGKEMNVCIDCRILMLREARVLMEMINSDFIITGEVLGQRPFSQLKDKIHLVERESGLRGKLLRPLSARLLPPTEPELSGLVDRERLESIQGRSRKRQMELAEQFGLDDYPSPAGGCLLTDHGYSERLRDLMTNSPGLTFADLNLLKVGRHFRLDNHTKIVVGRNEEDNRLILTLQQADHYLLEATEVGSPLTLLIGEASQHNLRLAGAITARYTKARSKSRVRIAATRSADGAKAEFEVTPAPEAEVNPRGIR